jgi:hypothetical protein
MRLIITGRNGNMRVQYGNSKIGLSKRQAVGF